MGSFVEQKVEQSCGFSLVFAESAEFHHSREQLPHSPVLRETV